MVANFIGFPSLSQEFDPAKDCSDIVDHLQDAKDDFYWISMGGGKVEKVHLYNKSSVLCR